MKKVFIGVLLCLICSAAFAADQKLEEQLKTIYQKAEKAIQENKIQEADFWLARYMGLTDIDETTEKNYTDLYPLFEKRKDLASTAFLSGKYSNDFIEFFILGPCELWGIPEKGVKEDDFEFQVRGDSEKDYYAAIVVSPRLESWSILKEGNISKAIIPLVSCEKVPFIVSGKLKDGKPIKSFDIYDIDVDKHFIQYIWPIEFHDLNGDGVPEIWIRYNMAWADGFSQRLDIYQIRDDKELVLLKRFEGEAEGIARRLKNGLIEVGEGFSNNNVGHLGYDQHHIQTFEYKNGNFVKISEKDIPHILWSEDWTKYYFDD